MKEKKYIDITYAQVIAIALIIIAVFVALFDNISVYASTDIRPTSGAYLEYNGQYLPLGTYTYAMYQNENNFTFAGTGNSYFQIDNGYPVSVTGHTSSLYGTRTLPSLDYITIIYATSQECLPTNLRQYYRPITACPIYHTAQTYDAFIKQYIAIAGSVNNGIVLDMSDMGEDALTFDISISGKRPSIAYMNSVKNAITSLPTGKPTYGASLDSLKNWLLEYDGHLIIANYRLNSLSLFTKQYGIIPTMGESYLINFSSSGEYTDGYIIISPTVNEWLQYNRTSGGIYNPTSEEEPYYYGLSSIDTIVVTPRVNNKVGKTTYSKFDSDGNLTTYYSINGLLSDTSNETINETYVEASQSQIERLQKEIDDLRTIYNNNMKEYIASQLDIPTDDTGILGGFSDIISTIGGLVSTVGGVSALFALFFSCLPTFVLQVISFTIVSLCIISIYKALRG